jgi:hypothetical protein
MTAADAVSAGVSYHTAAANYDGEYLLDSYRPGPGGYHNFDPGSGQDILNRVIVPPGEVLTCFLQWNDPFAGSSNDYDLEVYDLRTGARVVGVGGDRTQNGSQPPLEMVQLTNPFSYSVRIGIAILQYSGAPRSLKLLCPDYQLQYASQQFGISGQAARPEVVTVAAINATDPSLDTVEYFSSWGPAPIFFPTPVMRPKPDLAAFDGVVTTLPSGPLNPFFGTSAAAPHSAAIAALLLSKNPTLTPAQVQAALTSTAVDIGPAGFDYAAGFGRIDALAAINAVSAATTSPPTTTTTTLPKCDPEDCDGNICTIGDTCWGGVCRPGTAATPEKLSEFVIGRVYEATSACINVRDRAKVWTKVSVPLGKASWMLYRADSASGRKLRKRLSLARASAALATRQLSHRRPKLSSTCGAGLDRAVASANSALACMP